MINVKHNIQQTYVWKFWLVIFNIFSQRLDFLHNFWKFFFSHINLKQQSIMNKSACNSILNINRLLNIYENFSVLINWTSAPIHH